MSRKLIALIRGGLGNQMFTYAAAFRLAQKNDAELILDTTNGFLDDTYDRSFGLDHFTISARKATFREELRPFSRLRHMLLRKNLKHRSFGDRRMIRQELRDFDVRLVNLTFEGCRFIDGYWQSEKYFQDVSDAIRREFTICPPRDRTNESAAEKMVDRESVSVHVRWFDPANSSSNSNLDMSYYDRALEYMERNLTSPHYYLFSDNPVDALDRLRLPRDRTSLISNNSEPSMAFADLWLMQKCKHSVIANSTFSWWGAWLSETHGSIIISPKIKRHGVGAWGFDGLIPNRWIEL